ncbi:hypothetical protein HDK90DRAFT_215588 [Phyllosticta capitalensis]|uniref:Uncharacterized protein n=1 Tax=Phyllosticta capitalensis TaxID=121624 RepID=A0ABR1YU02_9PEZI
MTRYARYDLTGSCYSSPCSRLRMKKTNTWVGFGTGQFGYRFVCSGESTFALAAVFFPFFTTIHSDSSTCSSLCLFSCVGWTESLHFSVFFSAYISAAPVGGCCRYGRVPLGVVTASKKLGEYLWMDEWEGGRISNRRTRSWKLDERRRGLGEMCPYGERERASERVTWPGERSSWE